MTEPPARGIAPPRLGTVDEAFLTAGHVWLYEYPDGTPFESRLGSDGRLRFAFADGRKAAERPRRWVSGEAVPPAFGFVVGYLRTRFDRTALRHAVDDPTAVTLRCVAVHRRHRGYDWTRAPPVVGVDVDYPESQLLPHELERVFDELGVPTLPTIDTEVHVRDIGSAGIAPPESQWGEEPAYGVLYRKKGGGAARTVAGEYEGEPPPAQPITSSVEEYAVSVTSDEVLRSLVEAVGPSPSVSRLTDAAVDRTVRADWCRLAHGETTVDIEELRSAIARRVDAFLRGGSD
ncbi:hypothetical protein [Halobaculum sp. EA56]|uniref:hypothetical protein n=1 Tax=Halobaculum sp. EA56 TaxID=3421648 RepID=UPI003EBE4F09